MRIVLVISSLSCGGAEKVATALANHWVREPNEVMFILFDEETQSPFFPLSDRVEIEYLGLLCPSAGIREGVGNNRKRIQGLRQTIRAAKPDAVISFMDRTNVTTLFACFGLPIPVIVAERNDPARNDPGLVWRLLRRVTYRWAHAVVVQSEGFRNYFGPTLKDKVVVIPNPVLKPRYEKKNDNFNSKSPMILAIGKLHRQKGFDTMLKAFAELAPKYPQWSIRILGEGALRDELSDLAQKLDIADKVKMPGQVNDVGAYIEAAALFVMPSRYEGFPNALCEAMAGGLPVIVTDCSPSIKEIVQDGTNGIVVPVNDSAALNRKMDELMGDAELRAKLSEEGRKIVECFPIETIAKAWEGLIPMR
jgi:glycosyltransferase involved in cell wall biosynthesis